MNFYHKPELIQPQKYHLISQPNAIERGHPVPVMEKQVDYGQNGMILHKDVAVQDVAPFRQCSVGS